ncbi:hypothetical protein CMV_027675 [Castanea mollissima]|uniref:Uncharacterized protein n=1 Tax=Castanea mollissima TaxID=60419 RepID=A0A8J4Q911_9ROSI|nr:hypothetical protein CMV_027675 [Castanea mollissima]
MAFIQTSPYKGLEKYVMTKLFSRTFASVPEDAKIDREVSEKICLLQTFLKPEHLDIPAVLHNEASWLLAEKELQKINTFKAPQASPTLQGQTDPTPTRMHDKEEDTSGGSNYPYMDAEAGELTVGDVERLLSLYKDVVTKYTSLYKAVRHLSMYKTENLVPHSEGTSFLLTQPEGTNTKIDHQREN